MLAVSFIAKVPAPQAVLPTRIEATFEVVQLAVLLLVVVLEVPAVRLAIGSCIAYNRLLDHSVPVSSVLLPTRSDL
jgi:hypothetical protein